MHLLWCIAAVALHSGVIVKGLDHFYKLLEVPIPLEFEPYFGKAILHLREICIAVTDPIEDILKNLICLRCVESHPRFQEFKKLRCMF